MPRFPLLIGARPKFIGISAKVPLGVGRWRVTANHVSSELIVDNGSSYPLPRDGMVVIEGPTIVSIIILMAGDENGIDAFAELIHDIGTG